MFFCLLDNCIMRLDNTMKKKRRESRSVASDSLQPHYIVRQAPLYKEFSRQWHWSEKPFQGLLKFLDKCHCFSISKGHWYPDICYPFNVIYERHHDLAESIWTSQSTLGLNSSSSYLPALSLGKLSNLHEPDLHEPVSLSVNMD